MAKNSKDTKTERVTLNKVNLSEHPQEEHRTLIGILQPTGFVKVGKDFYSPPFRGTDEEGFPEVLVDARAVGGQGTMFRQSVKPYIGMKVEFVFYKKQGYNYKILGNVNES